MGGESDEEFAGFVRDASPRLLAAAWLLTADRHSAEELVQDALERVYLRWPRLRSGQPLAYARKVMTNLHTDRLSEQRTAEELGVSPGTVKSSASRGLARMRELLSEGDESRAHSR